MKKGHTLGEFPVIYPKVYPKLQEAIDNSEKVTKARKKCPIGFKKVQPFVQTYFRKIPFVPKKFRNAIKNYLTNSGYNTSNSRCKFTKHTRNSSRHTSRKVVGS